MYVQPPPLNDIWELPADRMRVVIESEPIATGDPRVANGYPHWDKIRHLDPPRGLNREEWWAAIAWSRHPGRRKLPFTTVDGAAFTFNLPDRILELLHTVDQRCAGEVRMPEVVTGRGDARDHYIVNSMMEEAIRSSQLEGAATSRRVAKEMLRSGRAPVDRSEAMIRNNYVALQFTRERIDDPLTAELILELHRIVTDGTFDSPDAAGRMQVPGEERIAVIDGHDNSVLHAPPAADELPERMEKLCRFANSDDGEAFVHPVIRAILLHFQLAYDHPFEDGNGRTARALFYWQMQRHGYWLTEYLSISRILRDAPSQYSKAFLLTESDHGDTTYFVLHQLEVIKRAIEEMDEYLARKSREIRKVEALLRADSGLNHRQCALLGEAIRDSGRTFTFQGHAGAHSVTHETARADLVALEERGLLERHRVGRRYLFTPPANLEGNLKKRGGGRLNTGP